MCGCQHKKYNVTPKFNDGGFVSELSVSEKAKYFSYLDENRDNEAFWDAESDDDAFGMLNKEFALDYTQALDVLNAWMVSRGLKKEGGIDEVGLDFELQHFDLDNLDDYETMVYNQMDDSISKVQALKIIINNVEGDFSQLSEGLSEIAEKYYKDYYKDGGFITANRRFTDNDYRRLINSGEFDATRGNHIWEIYKSGGGRILGHYNSDKESLYIIGKKDLSNPLVKWLSENSFVSNDEYFKLENGGAIINPSRYDFRRKNYDGELTELYIDGYTRKPTEKQVIDDLKAVKSRFREGSEYADFSPIVAVVYPYVYGWTKGYKINYSTSKENIERGFYDEVAGSRYILYFDKLENGGSVDKIASILVISSSNPLSTQLKKITGDSYNQNNFEDLYTKNPLVIEHNETEDIFVVFTLRYVSQVDEKEIESDLKWVKTEFDISGFKSYSDKINYADGGVITSDWGNDGSSAGNNKDYNELYEMFPDNHTEAKNIWNQLSDKQKEGFLNDLDVTDAASEHISESWLEFINASSYDDWLENATNWDEMKDGGNVDYSEAEKWWGNDLSLNEQKEYAKKHLLSFEYDELLGTTAQYSKANRRKKFITKIWEGEGRPKSVLDGLYANGGGVDNLEKELRKLQRDLNSSRLRTYREGDKSAEAIALKKEREVKLARFNEVLQLLRERDSKYANGGGVDNLISKQSVVSELMKLGYGEATSEDLIEKHIDIYEINSNDEDSSARSIAISINEEEMQSEGDEEYSHGGKIKSRNWDSFEVGGNIGDLKSSIKSLEKNGYSVESRMLGGWRVEKGMESHKFNDRSLIEFANKIN